MSTEQENEVLNLIEAHGDNAPAEAWRRCAELVNGKENAVRFDIWYEIAQQLEALK